MKQKNFFLLVVCISAYFLLSCERESLLPDAVTEYQLQVRVNASSNLGGDTIYIKNKEIILFFVNSTGSTIVPIQIDFGDGTIDGGRQILHSYSNAGVYKVAVMIVGTGITLNRVVKVSLIPTPGSIPGAYGDNNISTLGPCFRLDYEDGAVGAKDSLIIYVNCNYLGTDSAKYGISYSIDGGGNYFKPVKFIKNSKFTFCKIPVTQVSAVRFCSYKNLTTFERGEMINSVFYVEALGDCYVSISSTIKKPSRVANLEL